MKRLILIILTIVFNLPSFACDVCGNGVGGFNVGTMPSLSKDFIGIRYRCASFVSHQGSGRLFETNEVFQTAELWYRKQLGIRWQVMAFVPYHFNEQRYQNGMPNKGLSGFGDILLTGGYKIWNSEKMVRETDLVQQQLWLNAGIKLPTGKHQFKKDGTEVENANFQLGTGSADALMTALYSLRWNSTGLTADVSFRKNFENGDGYQFGDRITSNLYLFYSKPFKRLKVIPLAGLSVDATAMDKEESMYIYETGGTLLSVNGGLNLSFTKFNAGVLWQKPIQQNLGQGHLKANGSGMVQINYLF